MIRVATILAALLVTAPSNPSFVPQLYQAKDDVVAAIGLPKSIYSSGYVHYFPYALQRGDGHASGPGGEVYQRSYGGVDFEMRVFYGVDGEASGIARPERVRGVVLAPRIPAPIQTVLPAVPWLSKLCAAGCEELRVRSGESYFIYLYKKPSSPSSIDASEEAILAAALVPCLRVSFVTKSPPGNGPLPSFDDLQVDLVELALTHPDLERKLSGGAFSVSDWHPAP